jgi:dCMP deaminase
MSIISIIEKCVSENKSRISWDDYFISLSLLVSCRSSCERLHVGCVIVDTENRIVSVGYNGFLSGAPHTSRIREDHELSTVHAEQNAISYAAKSGISVNGCIVYITHYPCINCAKILCSSGIKKIYYHYDYKNDDIVQCLLKDVNIPIKKV